MILLIKQGRANKQKQCFIGDSIYRKKTWTYFLIITGYILKTEQADFTILKQDNY